VIGWLVLAAGPAGATEASAESRFVELANDSRSSSGLAGYAAAGDLADVARRHAVKMAAQHRIFHNANLGNDVNGWQQVGENVGMGETVDGVHQAFMQSPAHRGNIVSTVYREIGVGVATGDDGFLYVVQVFRLPMAAAAPAPAAEPVAAAPKPAASRVAKPAPAPKPAPKPAPTPTTTPALAPVPVPPASAPIPDPTPELAAAHPAPTGSPVSIASAPAAAPARLVAVPSASPAGPQRPAPGIIAAAVLAILATGSAATQLLRAHRRTWSTAPAPAVG
jgi:hypothetical protein